MQAHAHMTSTPKWQLRGKHIIFLGWAQCGGHTFHTLSPHEVTAHLHPQTIVSTHPHGQKRLLFDTTGIMLS